MLQQIAKQKDDICVKCEWKKKSFCGSIDLNRSILRLQRMFRRYILWIIKKLITAVEKVRSYCHNQENCLDCIFYDIDLDCCNIQGIPDEWVYSRFSQDEVKLAKILKKYGVCRIARKGPVAYWGTKDGFGGYFPKGMFENMGETEEVSIDEVNR